MIALDEREYSIEELQEIDYYERQPFRPMIGDYEWIGDVDGEPVFVLVDDLDYDALCHEESEL